MTKWNKPEGTKGYQLALSFWMMAALVDLSLGYAEEDSPVHMARTMTALRKRGLVVGNKLTNRGRKLVPYAASVMSKWTSTDKALVRRMAA